MDIYCQITDYSKLKPAMRWQYYNVVEGGIYRVGEVVGPGAGAALGQGHNSAEGHQHKTHLEAVDLSKYDKFSLNQPLGVSLKLASPRCKCSIVLVNFLL